MRFFYFLGLVAVVCFSSLSVGQVELRGQDSASQEVRPTNWRGARMALERDFGDELKEIAKWCRDNDIEHQVDPTFAIFQNRDLGRQYIFMPSEQSMPTGPDDVRGQWLEKINAAKVAHAEQILELAKQAVKEDAGAVAFQLLHEVIHYNRDHAGVRAMLGHRKTETGWKVASDSVKVKKTSRPHDIVSWRAKSYIKILTPHFEIASNASEERTRFLAEQLERSHLVWRQVFSNIGARRRCQKLDSRKGIHSDANHQIQGRIFSRQEFVPART